VLLPLSSRGHTAFTLAWHYGLTPYMPRICFTVYIPIGCVNAAILVPFQEQGEIQAQWRTVEVDYVRCCINTQRICRSILMQGCKMYQSQCSQQERKQVMKAVETVQSRVIYAKASPLPPNNGCTNYWQSTCQTCNYCSTP
jgi:hypothetical protein